jgi:hypothetical protein
MLRKRTSGFAILEMGDGKKKRGLPIIDGGISILQPFSSSSGLVFIFSICLMRASTIPALLPKRLSLQMKQPHPNQARKEQQRTNRSKMSES